MEVPIAVAPKAASRRASTPAPSLSGPHGTNHVANLRQTIEHALDDLKAVDVAIIPLEGKSSMADYLIIAGGTSTRHASSLAANVEKELKAHGFRIYGVEGKQSGDWVCVDAGDIIVHIFEPETRKLYNLEKLWSF